MANYSAVAHYDRAAKQAAPVAVRGLSCPGKLAQLAGSKCRARIALAFKDTGCNG
ncbi:hypothetical protein ACFFW8_04080 [Erwinia tracheiphila]